MSGIGNLQVSTAFLSPDGGTTSTGPFVLPPQIQMTPGVLTLNVPYVAGPQVNPNGSGCTIPAKGNNLDFALTSWVSSPNTNDVTNAVITVQPGNAYSLKPSEREQLWTSFFTFRKAFDDLEASGCLLTGAAAVLGMRVAQALPLTLAETLTFAYGLRPALRCVDIMPGMTVRVDYGDYAYVAPPAASGGTRNAYGGMGTTRFHVRRRSDGTLGFDALVDAFAAYQNPNPDQYGQVAGLLDIQAAGATLKYGRLVYPPQIDAVTFIASAPNPANNVALIFAGTLDDLETATQNFVNGGSTQGVGVQWMFSGRVAVSLEILIVLNGTSLRVPFGTTLRDLIDTSVAATIAEYYLPGGGGNLNLTLSRWLQQSLAPPTTTFSLNQAQFEQTTRTVPPANQSQWDLPLFAGDVVTWGPFTSEAKG